MYFVVNRYLESYLLKLTMSTFISLGSGSHDIVVILETLWMAWHIITTHELLSFVRWLERITKIDKMKPDRQPCFEHLLITEKKIVAQITKIKYNYLCIQLKKSSTRQKKETIIIIYTCRI